MGLPAGTQCKFLNSRPKGNPMNTGDLSKDVAALRANVQAVETFLVAITRVLPSVASAALRQEISLAIEGSAVRMLNSPIEDSFRLEVARNLLLYAAALP